MIFEHTSKEPGMWRGWLGNGQSVEPVWKKSGWSFGAGVHTHTNDDDRGSRLLFLNFWRGVAVIPLGIAKGPFDMAHEPQYSVYASQEFGLTFHWGLRRWSFDWPWSRHVLAYEAQLPDGSWEDVFAQFRGHASTPYHEQYPYTYTLRSGEVQHRTATVTKERFVLTWCAFKAIGWPRWIEESIDVQFDDEVGERTGTWKGGTVGCGYDLQPGESMLQALRRMEGERKF